MTKPRSSAARVDHILALIDECLAEVDTSLRPIAGEGRTSPTHPARRHLTLLGSA